MVLQRTAIEVADGGGRSHSPPPLNVLPCPQTTTLEGAQVPPRSIWWGDQSTLTGKIVGVLCPLLAKWWSWWGLSPQNFRGAFGATNLAEISIF